MGAEQELTDPDAVVAAMAEFDNVGREVFLGKYGFGHAYKYLLVNDGREYDAKAIIGVARGIQHQERGPLKSEDFSSREKAVRQLLESLGFEIKEKQSVTSEPRGSMSIQALIQSALEDLAGKAPGVSPKFSDAAALKQIIHTDLPAALNERVGPTREARGSIGMGMVADVPWVAVFDKDGPASAKNGYYLVYLFAADGSAVYLSLNQGTENLKGGTAPLRKRGRVLAITARWQQRRAPSDSCSRDHVGADR